MSRFLTKTSCFSMELNLEHPKHERLFKLHLLRWSAHRVFDLTLYQSKNHKLNNLILSLTAEKLLAKIT